MWRGCSWNRSALISATRRSAKVVRLILALSDRAKDASHARAARHNDHCTSTPFDRLNVLEVQNAAALRYHT